MRGPLAGLGALVGFAVVAAAPAADAPRDKALRDKLHQQEAAQRYTLAVINACDHVAKQYVRPVDQRQLIRAALEGLYEAARLPIPGTLAEQVRRTDSQSKMMALVQETRRQIGNLEPLREPNDLIASLRGMARLLDPHSGPVAADEMNRADGADTTAGWGLDVPDHFGVGPLVVRAVLPGGPAQRAGVRPGDRITHIDGKSVRGAPAVYQRLRQPDAEQPIVRTDSRPRRIRLTLARASGNASYDVTLDAEEFRPETILGVARRNDNAWDFFADRPNRIAHVRVSTLADGTAEELLGILTALRGQGMRGLILDLRWCPGGKLIEAVNIAEMFVGNARALTVVATVKNRDGRINEYSTSHERKFDVPLVVLLNGETSGGAELIAAALQDHGRARVVGQRTRGKGSVQSPLPVPAANLYFKLTTGTFQRPSGKNMHRFPDSKPTDDWGVRPDRGLESRVSPDLAKRLKEWWLLQTLRPGSSTEILPLDDPTSDPQRQDALAALEKVLRTEG